MAKAPAADPMAENLSEQLAPLTERDIEEQTDSGSFSRGQTYFRKGYIFDPIRRGAESAGRSLQDLDLTVSVSLEFTDDVDEASRRHARGYAFTFGAMGSAKNNFYKDAFARHGFGEDVDEVQRLWLEGDRDAAADRVPVDIGFKTNLVGTPELITERLRLYRDAGITTLRVGVSPNDLPSQLDSLGRLLDLVDGVNAEQAAVTT